MGDQDRGRCHGQSESQTAEDSLRAAGADNGCRAHSARHSARSWIPGGTSWPLPRRGRAVRRDRARGGPASLCRSERCLAAQTPGEHVDPAHRELWLAQQVRGAAGIDQYFQLFRLLWLDPRRDSFDQATQIQSQKLFQGRIERRLTIDQICVSKRSGSKPASASTAGSLRPLCKTCSAVRNRRPATRTRLRTTRSPTASATAGAVGGACRSPGRPPPGAASVASGGAPPPDRAG